MHGFIALISPPSKSFSVSWKDSFPFQGEFIKRNINNQDFHIEQYTSSSFIENKLWIENNEHLFISEGIILNLEILRKQYHADNAINLISLLYKKKKTFFEEFEGNFAGLLYSKQEKKWFFFNNHTATQKLFYFHQHNFTAVSTDLYTLQKALQTLNINLPLDIEAAYLLLSSGFMHENKTLVEAIKQIRAGEYIEVSEDKIFSNFYFHLNNIAQNKDNKIDTIQKLDYLFKEAIKLEFEYPLSTGMNHITTLSGGLDSRMTFFIAYKLGFKEQYLLNFSLKDYADDVISREIAQKTNIPIHHISLSAKSLLPIEQNILVNDGLTLYTGASHVFYSIEQIKDTKGFIHTGMLGDVAMGSYLTHPTKEVKPTISAGMYSQTLLPKVEHLLNASCKNYRNEEIYKLYNRGFLGINNGFLFFDLIGESFSPFLNSKFLSYALSIPRQLRYHESLYIDWIKTLHPDIASFTWEAIGGKPTNNKILRSFYRYKRAIIKRIPVKSMWKHHMTPEQLWYDKDLQVKQTLDNYFKEHIDLAENKEFRQDLIFLYQTGGITEKTQILTLLGAIRLLFH